MSARFADSNILLYAISRAPEEKAKAKRAEELLAQRDLVLSAQVLQEFYVQATRTSRADPISHEDARELVAAFRRFPVLPITAELVDAAMATCARFQLSYWDAAILEAARLLGCEVVLSEDLSDDQDYDGVRVENPFRVP